MRRFLHKATIPKTFVINDKGEKKEKLSFHFYPYGRFACDYPFFIKELRATTIDLYLGTRDKYMTSDAALADAFRILNNLDSQLETEREYLEELTGDDRRRMTDIQKKLYRHVSGDVTDKITELSTVEYNRLWGLELEVQRLHREFEERIKEIDKDNFSRRDIRSYRIDPYLCELCKRGERLGFRHLTSPGFDTRVLQRSVMGLDIETAYSPAEVAASPGIEAQMLSYLRNLPEFRGLTDYQIKQVAKQEIIGLKEHVTDIGYIGGEGRRAHSRIYSIHKGPENITAILKDNRGEKYSTKCEIIAAAASGELRGRRFEQYVNERDALAALPTHVREKKMARLRKRFGVLKRDHSSEARILEDIGYSENEKMLERAARHSCIKLGPLVVVIQNVPFDMSKLSNMFSNRSEKTWRVDEFRTSPKRRPVYSRKALKPVEILARYMLYNTYFVDPFRISQITDPEIGNRDLDSLFLHHGGIGALKDLSHQDLNIIEFMCDMGDTSLLPIQKKYHALDLLKLWFVNHKQQERREYIAECAEATGMDLQAALNSPNAVEHLWMERYFWGNNRSLTGYGFFRYWRMMRREKLADEFKAFKERRIRAWGIHPERFESTPKDVFALYTPLSYYAKELIRENFPKLRQFLQEKYTLSGELRQQVTFSRYLDVLLDRIDFDHFYKNHLNRRYESNLSFHGITREEFRTFTAVLQRAYGLQIEQYSRALFHWSDALCRLEYRIAKALDSDTPTPDTKGLDKILAVLQDQSAPKTLPLFKPSSLLELNNPVIKQLDDISSYPFKEEVTRGYVEQLKEAHTMLTGVPDIKVSIAGNIIPLKEALFLYCSRDKLSQEASRFMNTYRLTPCFKRLYQRIKEGEFGMDVRPFDIYARLIDKPLENIGQTLRSKGFRVAGISGNLVYLQRAGNREETEDMLRGLPLLYLGFYPEKPKRRRQKRTGQLKLSLEGF